MTKKLTEQWREGELFGFHYVKEPKEKPNIHNVSCMDYLLDKNGVEVLAPVPSYDEIKRLQKQLNEANEVILLANYVVDAYDEIDKYLEKWGLK